MTVTTVRFRLGCSVQVVRQRAKPRHGHCHLAAKGGCSVTADWRLELMKPPICRVLGLARGYGAGEKRIKRAEPFLPMLSAILLYGIELRLISRSAPAVAFVTDAVS